MTTGASLQAAVNISVASNSIVISGVTPGGDVLVFGRSCRQLRGRLRLTRHVFMQRDEDGDGAVTVVEAIPRSSVFVAVDYESGEFAIASPATFVPRVIALPPTRPWREGSVNVDLRRGYLDFLLVRPRKGAWALEIIQGSARDDDGLVDATLRLRVSAMLPLFGKDSPPPHASKKDVLAIIDPRELDVVIVAAE
jgi:hypothetical protein